MKCIWEIPDIYSPLEKSLVNFVIKMKNRRVLLGILFLTLITFSSYPVLASAVFSVSIEDRVLVGQSSDGDQEDLIHLFFHPAPIYGKYGYFTIRFARDGIPVTEDSLVNHAGMNDQGLVVAPTSVPTRQLNLHPEKPKLNDTVVNTLLSSIATVPEIISLLENYQPLDSDPSQGGWQLLITDKTGDAVSISVGPDGEFHFSRKTGNFKVITNFNVADPSWGKYPDTRYERMTDILEKVDTEDVLIDLSQSILETIHWEGIGTNTIYSNIYDPVNGNIHLYYFHQFEEVVVLNLEEELTKGEHYYNYRDLFSQDIVEKASQEKSTYQLIRNGIMVGVLIISLLCIGLIGVLISKTAKKSNLTFKGKAIRSFAILLIALIGLPLICLNGLYFCCLMSTNYIDFVIQWPGQKILRFVQLVVNISIFTTVSVVLLSLIFIVVRQKISKISASSPR